VPALHTLCLHTVAGLGNAHTERWRKHTLLAQLRVALGSLALDGVLVAKIGDTFTRFSASLVYVLALVFADLRIVKSLASAPWTCDRYIIARGFQGLSPSLAQHLAAVHAKLDTCVDTYPEQDVLVLVPISRLLSPTFFRFLCRLTERYAQRESNAVALLGGLAARPVPSNTDVAEAHATALLQVPFLAVADEGAVGPEIIVGQ
jgi:hypothetical protein